MQAPGGDDPEKKKKRLIVGDLTIQKKDSAPVLDQIDLTVHEGEILGIAGVSDNGQQELCEALYGAETPTQGKILLDGRDITATSVKDRITMREWDIQHQTVTVTVWWRRRCPWQRICF